MPQHPPEIKRVLLTGAGAPGTLQMISSLNASKRYELIGADANQYSAAFPLVRRGYVIPMGTDPDFKDAMFSLLSRERPDFVVPLVDEEIPVVHRLVRDHFPSTSVICPRLEFATLAMDKWAMAKALTDADLSTAHTWLASAAEECRYPAIIKPRAGRGSRGFSYLDNQDDLRRYLATTANDPDQYVVQERLIGTEFTTSAVVTLSGELLSVVPKEVVDKRGITKVGVTRIVPEIHALCADIQRRLQANGPFNVQLVLTSDRVPKVFEINPRYSTTTALTIAAGIDELDLVIRSQLGETFGELAFQPDLMMIRHETQIFVAESQWQPELATNEQR